MKKLLLCLLVVVAVAQTAPAEVEWLTSVSTAMERARAENKTVLLDFTGSDWCGWCKKLKGEVFDQPEFAAYANTHLIMVEVDFPRHITLSPAQTAANQNLATTYNIHGYPTVVLINGTGAEVGRGGYVPGGPGPFIASLEAMPGYGHHGATVADAPAAPAPAPKTAAQLAALLPGATPPIVVKYGDVTLKGVSGAGTRRLVLINDQTLMVGETGRVKTHEERIKITVKEIHDDSAIVIVDGKEKELFLGEPAKLAVQ